MLTPDVKPPILINQLIGLKKLANIAGKKKHATVRDSSITKFHFMRVFSALPPFLLREGSIGSTDFLENKIIFNAKNARATTKVTTK